MKTIKSWASKLMRSCQKRRLANGIEVGITLADVEKLLTDSNGRCAVTGIPFSEEQLGNFSRRPFAPSLDRINSKLGYVHGNLRVVCVAVNYAMSDWGEWVLLRIAKAIHDPSSVDVPWMGPKLTGAVYRSKTDRWEARITVGGKRVYLGTYRTAIEAHEKSDAAERGIREGRPIDDFITPRQAKFRKSLHPFALTVNATL